MHAAQSGHGACDGRISVSTQLNARRLCDMLGLGSCDCESQPGKLKSLRHGYIFASVYAPAKAECCRLLDCTMVDIFQQPAFACWPLARAITIPVATIINLPQHTTFNYIQYPVFTRHPPVKPEAEAPPAETPRTIEAPPATPSPAASAISVRMSFYSLEAVTGTASTVGYDSPPNQDRLLRDVKHYARRAGVVYDPSKWKVTACALHADANVDDLHVAKGVIGPVMDDSVICVADGDSDAGRDWDALWRGVVRSGHCPVVIVQEVRPDSSDGEGA